jgi:hypothetical protein
MDKAAAPPAARESAAAADSSHGAVRPQRIGTGHGEREWSPVGQARFERASSRPSQVTQLRYDDRDALVAMGIIPREPWRHANGEAPRAFPDGFVADPPNR